MILIQMTDFSSWFRLYYGPEYISHQLMAWAQKRCIQLHYIQPGNPHQNAYVERFNRTVRQNGSIKFCLNQLATHRKQQLSGYGVTIMNGLIQPWEGSLPLRN